MEHTRWIHAALAAALAGASPSFADGMMPTMPLSPPYNAVQPRRIPPGSDGATTGDIARVSGIIDSVNSEGSSSNVSVRQDSGEVNTYYLTGSTELNGASDDQPITGADQLAAGNRVTLWLDGTNILRLSVEPSPPLGM